jgi:hypothetical protein
MTKNEISYFWEIHKMNFQGPEGKVGSWVLELGNNSIEYGAENIAVDIPVEKGDTFSYHDDGNGIEKATFSKLFGLIKGMDRATFNRWNEGLKKDLNLLIELYVETKHQIDGYNAGLFRWKQQGDYIDYYDPILLEQPLPEDDWDDHIRHKRNVMKYSKGTTFVPKFMFNTEKQEITTEKFTYWFKKYYHLLLMGINYKKINFHVQGKLIEHDLAKLIPEIKSMEFVTTVYNSDGHKTKQKFKIPVIIFRSDKPLPEEFRGIFIVVNGIRVEEIKINIPSEIEENLLIYFCADFFTRKDLTEDRQGLINRDKTNVMDSSTKKMFTKEAKSEVTHLLGEEKKEVMKSKMLNKLNKKLADLINSKKWKDLLKLPTIPPPPPREPECPECHTKKFETWREDERYNICENGHKWLKNRWTRKCPKCGKSDYSIENDGEREKFTCNVCNNVWFKEKRPRPPVNKLSVYFKDDTPLLAEVRYDKENNTIYINMGVPTYSSPEKIIGLEHYYKCVAKALSEIVADIHDWEKGSTQSMRLYYDAYMDLKEFTKEEKERFAKKQLTLKTTEEKSTGDDQK